MPDNTPKDNGPPFPQGTGNPPPAPDTSPGAQGSSSAGAPKGTKAPVQQRALGAPGAAGEEVALAAGRTNWPDDPDRYRYQNTTGAGGHRPPTLAKDPTAPVYVPGDPNSLIPGEVDHQGREPNPPPAPLPEAGDDYYMVRPEPALDDIPRDARAAHTQEAHALEQANAQAREDVVTRDGGEWLDGPGKGQLRAEVADALDNNGVSRSLKGAKPYRPAGKPVKRPVE